MHNIKNLIYLNIVHLLSLIFYIFISNFFPNKKIDIIEINNFGFIKNIKLFKL
jgi:hypothetical protein